MHLRIYSLSEPPEGLHGAVRDWFLIRFIPSRLTMESEKGPGKELVTAVRDSNNVATGVDKNNDISSNLSTVCDRKRGTTGKN